MKSMFLVLVLFLFSNDSRDLYVMYNKEYALFKIGISNDVDRRIKEVNRETCGETVVFKRYVGFAHLEKPLHDFFSSNNQKLIYENGVISREWFCLDSRELNQLDSIVNISFFQKNKEVRCIE